MSAGSPQPTEHDRPVEPLVSGRAALEPHALILPAGPYVPGLSGRIGHRATPLGCRSRPPQIPWAPIASANSSHSTRTGHTEQNTSITPVSDRYVGKNAAGPTPLWLSSKAGKAARWLQYVPFESIVDQRNAAPIVRIFKRPYPRSYINVGIDIEIPDVDDLAPRVGIQEFVGVQPYKLVIFGEKSSLEPVLGPIADQRKADLYLPTGEISDTLLHRMARVGAEDGRPMVVFCFSDADPAGWQMPISIGRKLQALKALEFHGLDFEVHRVALTPDHVREYGLPSTPLKEKEKRADAWRAAMGIDQTEIDALASLQPDLLRQIARDAIRPFYDGTLDHRVNQARQAWREAAQNIVNAAIDQEHLERLRTDAAARLDEMSAEIDVINEALQVNTDDFDLPDFEIPEPEVVAWADGKPLVSSEWSFAEQCQRLIESKRYGNGQS